jgi:LuxR family maltose regulon positive regulatory protein
MGFAQLARYNEHLVNRLVSSPGMLAILHAPAGFGKTVLLDEVRRALRQRGAPVSNVFRTRSLGPAPWLLIDEPAAGSLSAERLHRALDAALAHNIGIIVATRHIDRLPIARLRAEGRVVRFGPQQIGMPRRHAAAMLHTVLDRQRAEWLSGYMSGWSVGAGFLMEYARGSDAHFDEQGDFLAASGFSSYIDQEILAGLPDEWIAALRILSIVSSADRAMLDEIFPEGDLGRHLIALRMALPGLVDDREGRTYLNPLLRLHLARRFDQLPRTKRGEIFDRASRHMARIGRALEAAELAIRIDDPDAVIDFVRRSEGLRLWVVAGADVLRVVVAKVGGQALRDEPRLKLLKCIVHLKDGEVDAAQKLYEEVARESGHGPDVERDTQAVRMALLVYGCRLATREDVIDCRRSILRSGDDPVWQTMVLSMQCIINIQRGDIDVGMADIVEATMQARAAGSDYPLLFLDIHKATAALARGELAKARGLLGFARRDWRQKFPGDVGLQTTLDALTANLEFEAGRLSSARVHIRRSTHQMPHVEAWFDIYAAAYEPMARLLLTDVGLASTLATLRLQQEALQTRGLQRIASLIGALEACLIGEAHLRGEAGLQLKALPDPGVPEALMTWQEREFFGLAETYRCLGCGDAAGAVGHLKPLLTFADERGLHRTALRARLLLVAALDGHANEEADSVFDVALLLGAASAMSRVFAEIGGEAVRRRVQQRLADIRGGKLVEPELLKLLRTIARWLETPAATASAVFTARERDVLLALEQGGADKMIGRRLGVSEHAVRYHLKNIYRKLRVHDRVGALNRARDMGFLG